jgi:ankyrin repeat protein
MPNAEATKVQDNDGWLPLQFALRYEASNDVIKMILKSNPDATKVQSKYGRLPLHYALQ